MKIKLGFPGGINVGSLGTPPLGQGSAAAPDVAASLSVGLANVWRLNEASGDRLDSVGSKTLILVGTIPTVLGVDGSNTCRFHNQFTAPFGYLKSTDNALQIGEFSIALIVTRDETSQSWMFSKDGNSPPNREYKLGFLNSTAKYTFHIYDNGGNTPDIVETAAVSQGTLDFIVCRYRAGHMSIDLNSVRTEKDTAVVPIAGTGPFNIGAYNNANGTTAPMAIQHIHRWTRYLTDAETDLLWNSGKLRLYPFTAPLQTDKLLVFDGDSHTQMNFYPHQLMGLLGRIRPYYNKAVSAQNTDALLADAATEIYPLYSAAYAKNILCVMIGTNDIAASANTTTMHNTLTTYCTGARTAGFKVVVATIPNSTHVSRPPAFDTDRQAYNTLIRNNYTNYADGLADVGGDATLGQTLSPDDTEYFSDKTHFTVSGNAIVANLFYTAINAIP